MRAHADGLYCAQAAAELLIEHRVWLGRAEFVDRFVQVCAGWTGAVMAVVDWSGCPVPFELDPALVADLGGSD